MSLLGAPRALAEAPHSDEERRFQEAREHYQKDRYREAASAFEALWADHPHPKYLYYAGLAHEGVGQDALAILAWRRSLDGAGEADVVKTTARLEKALARTVVLDLHVQPTVAALTSHIEFSRVGVGTTFVLAWHALEDVGEDRRRIHLEPGEWQIHVQPGGIDFAPLQRRVTLAFAQKRTEVAFDLPGKILPTAALSRPAPPPSQRPISAPVRPSDRNLRIGLGTGLGVAGLGTAVAGALILRHNWAPVFTPTSAKQVSTTDSDPCDLAYADNNMARAPCHNADEIGKPLDRVGQAGALLGATFGLWTSGAIGAVRPRRGPLSIAAGGGAVSLVAGLAAFFVTDIVRRRDLSDDDVFVTDHNWRQYRVQMLSTGLAMGLGAGLLTGSGIGLLARHRTFASPTFQRAGLGLSITTQF